MQNPSKFFQKSYQRVDRRPNFIFSRQRLFSGKRLCAPPLPRAPSVVRETPMKEDVMGVMDIVPMKTVAAFVMSTDDDAGPSQMERKRSYMIITQVLDYHSQRNGARATPG